MSGRIIVALVGTLLAGCVAQSPAPPPPAQVSFLHTAGLHIVNERGDRVALRGYNLGSWLLLEPWMVKLDSQDGVQAEKDIWDQIARRFGEEKMRAAVAAHRASFITESDIERLHQLHVNFVRVPIWWRVLGDTTYDADGWRYVDHLLDWCERRGMYVLLDLHGAPGGQNTGANILGEQPTGNYWLSDRTATLEWWRKVAQRYRNRAVVAGYDLLNEAWGAPTVKALAEHMDEIYRAVREIDPRHMIFIEDGLKGYYRLPQPAAMGWSNVVYSFHFYPEDGPKFASHDLLGVRMAQLFYGVPVHIGEFSIYNTARGGVSLLDRCLQIFNVYDWSWTLWSYKLLEDNPDYFWSLTGYTDERLPGITLKTSSYDDILAFFRSTNWREHALTRACIGQRTRDLPLGPSDPLELLPQDAFVLAQHDLHVEWQWTPPNLGFWGPGDAAAWHMDVPQDSNYQLELLYAAGGNAPDGELFLDGVRLRTFTLTPTSGWADYRRGTVALGRLTKGEHALRVACAAGESFLNLREMKLTLAPVQIVEQTADEIVLTPAEIARFDRHGEVCVEWQNSPPNIGHWTDGDAVVFHFRLPREEAFVPSFEWSSPNERTGVQLTIAGRPLETVTLSGTGDWQKYEWQRAASTLTLPAGEIELRIIAVEVANEAGAGNLRTIKLERHAPE